MLLPSSLLVSLFLLTAPALAAPADDGQWHPAGTANQGAGAGTVQTQTEAATQVTATRVGTTTAALVATAKAQTGTVAADWQTVVTWPAGCEKWANPCPPGAPIAGGGVAGGHTATGRAQPTVTADVGAATSLAYENGFTSYTTMTDENGVITGMPSKATVAAGVETTMKTAIKSGAANSSVVRAAATSAAESSSRQSSFAQASSSARAQTGAAPKRVADVAAILGAVIIAVAVL
jgi:hypothetical protein